MVSRKLSHGFRDSFLVFALPFPGWRQEKWWFILFHFFQERAGGGLFFWNFVLNLGADIKMML